MSTGTRTRRKTAVPTRRQTAQPATNRPGVAAELAEPFLARITSLAARDRLLAELMPGAAANLPRLVTALQATPDTDLRLADLAAVTAMVAYRSGDGPWRRWRWAGCSP